MAVTITASDLAGAIRIGSSPDETAQATRLLTYANEAVTMHAPDAPDTAHNEAALRVAGYLFDMPTAAGGVCGGDKLDHGSGGIFLPRAE